VHAKLQQADKAQQLLRQAIQEYPRSPWSEIARTRLKTPDKNQPAPHSLPAAAGVLTPDMKLLPLEPQGQQQVDRAPLEDPTEAASQAVTMARLPPLRRTQAPWLPLALPDPFEHHAPFPFQEPPEDERLPLHIALRVPQP
jgi:hypothetical protein